MERTIERGPRRPGLVPALLVCFTFTGTSSTLADIRLPAVIGDHMVLQQNRQAPIWGWAEPGEVVTVRLGSQARSTKANQQGRWQVTLDTGKAGGPWELVIQGQNTVTIRDVLVGEVWLCSGQSNMQFALQSTTTASTDVPAADLPQIRLLKVPRESVLEPRETLNSAWVVCSPETAAGFSAVGYYFGRELHRELQVPVGLIDSSWGGTNAEEWTAAPFLDPADPEIRPVLDRWENASAENKQLLREPLAFSVEFDDVRLSGSLKGSELVIDDFEGPAGLANRLGGRWTLSGPVPDRFTAQRTKSRSGNQSLIVSGKLRISDTAMLEVGFAPGGVPKDISHFESLVFRVRGHGFLKFHALQPSISDWDHYVSGIIPVTESWQEIKLPFSQLRQAGWGKQLPFTPREQTGASFEFIPGRAVPTRPPSGLYNGMIAPLVPFAIRGAAWYQGEGNAGRSYQYRKLLPALIKSWRSLWKQGDFPFLIVQLPNYRPRQEQPSESGWAELREAQMLTLKHVPATGLAVTIDQGEADDVHPRQKVEVGKRLAAWALGTTYGRDIVYSGPLFDSAEKEAGKFRVRFAHVGSGLEARGDGGLRGFAVAGHDRVFHWAEARIEGPEVVVSSEKVHDPVAVRYAWADNPDCNLYNREGFPASPFRTDKWPGVTARAR